MSASIYEDLVALLERIRSDCLYSNESYDNEADNCSYSLNAYKEVCDEMFDSM